MGKDGGRIRRIPDSHTHRGIAAKKDYVQAKNGRSRYKRQDSSSCMRVVKDGPDGVEFIISGDREESFAETCRANWYFESVKRKSDWFIEDERGNDVSDKPIGSVDGIFTLIAK